MDKLQMNPPFGLEAPPRLVVKVQRVARPPSRRIWAICEEIGGGRARCSTHLYRSAEEAWAVGRAVLDRLPRSPTSA
jgi:hypothetical protein